MKCNQCDHDCGDVPLCPNCDRSEGRRATNSKITIVVYEGASLEIEAKIVMAIQNLRMELAGYPLAVLPEGAVAFAIVNTPEHLYRLTHFEPSDIGNRVPS